MRVTPAEALEVAEAARKRSGRRVQVVWVVLEQNRGAFCEEVEEGRGDAPVVALVVRERGLFTSANALMEDFGELVRRNRERFETPALRGNILKAGGVSVLVVSRERLTLPGIASPLDIPDWFPVGAGEREAVWIDTLRDLRRSAVSEEACAGQRVRRALREVEEALEERLDAVIQAGGHRDVSSLVDQIAQQGDARSPAEFVATARRVCEARRGDGFRPDSRSEMMISRLAAAVQRKNRDELGRLGGALWRAIAGHEAAPLDALEAESIGCVFMRPPARGVEPGPRFGVNIALLVDQGVQLLNALSHSDQYRQYRRELLETVAEDLAESLEHAADGVRSLERNRDRRGKD